ncbi:MAG: hypothetical protein ACRYGF_08030 [Janthinobacterium lividum]
MILEKEAQTIAPEDHLATCRVCEKLRRPLSHLVGIGGVRALLVRALTLAKREAQALADVEVMEDASFRGLEGEAAAESPVLISHLIQLLITFVGEDLTLRILHDVWPELESLKKTLGRAGL